LLVRHAVFERHAPLRHGHIDIAAILDPRVGLHRDVEQALRILVDGGLRAVFLRHFVIDAVDVAAAAVGHDADHAALRVDALLQTFREKAEVIGADVLVAKVVHGEVRQHGQRLAIGALNGDEREIRVLGAGFAGHIIPHATRVHVRPHAQVAKRVLRELVRPANPLTQRGEGRRVLLRKTDAGWLERLLSRGDGLDEFFLQKRHISRVRLRAETSHRGRCRMRMRGGDQQVIRRDARLRRRHLLRLIEQLPSHHAAIHHHDGHRLLPIRRHDGAGIHPRVDLVEVATQHPAIHQHRQLRRCDVDHRRSSLKLRVEWLDSEKGEQREKSADHGPQNTGAAVGFSISASAKAWFFELDKLHIIKS
jgi:hypothetical protein